MAKLVDDGFLDLKRELLAERYRGVGHDYDDVRGKETYESRRGETVIKQESRRRNYEYVLS